MSESTTILEGFFNDFGANKDALGRAAASLGNLLGLPVEKLVPMLMELYAFDPTGDVIRENESNSLTFPPGFRGGRGLGPGKGMGPKLGTGLGPSRLNFYKDHVFPTCPSCGRRAFWDIPKCIHCHADIPDMAELRTSIESAIKHNKEEVTAKAEDNFGANVIVEDKDVKVCERDVFIAKRDIKKYMPHKSK